MNPLHYLLYFTLLTLLACGGNEPTAPGAGPQVTTGGAAAGGPTGEEQLNLTVLLDLSDRIEPDKYPASPEHAERDIAIVRHLTQLFRADMESKGAYQARGKLRVVFSPRPQDSEINTIASRLSVNLAELPDARAKKEVFDNIEATFTDNLRHIYDKTIATKDYPGADVWRFFKNDVVDYAIDRDQAYRNVLIILTDGYLYHEASTTVDGSRSAHLTPQRVGHLGLRGNDWQRTFDEGDYGYLTTRDDLQHLEVLVLEVSPTPAHQSDEDVIRAYLSKWFTEMGVERFSIYNSDLPEYTKGRIDNFLLR